MPGIDFKETGIILLVTLLVFAVARLPEFGLTLDRVVDATKTAAQVVEAEITKAPELPAPDDDGRGTRSSRETD